MGSLWTPGGERPVSREAEEAPEPQLTAEQEQLLGELEQARHQLAQTPASLVVANHAIGLFQLAGVHLSQSPPNLQEASLAIDALAALVEGLHGRLGEEEETLRDALAQLQLAYVEVSRRQ